MVKNNRNYAFSIAVLVLMSIGLLMGGCGGLKTQESPTPAAKPVAAPSVIEANDDSSAPERYSPLASANSPPVAHELDTVTMPIGKQLEIQLEFSDADGDALTYRLIPADNPSVSISETGLLTLAPKTPGWHPFTVVVSDGTEETLMRSAVNGYY